MRDAAQSRHRVRPVEDSRRQTEGPGRGPPPLYGSNAGWLASSARSERPRPFARPGGGEIVEAERGCSLGSVARDLHGAAARRSVTSVEVHLIPVVASGRFVRRPDATGRKWKHEGFGVGDRRRSSGLKPPASKWFVAGTPANKEPMPRLIGASTSAEPVAPEGWVHALLEIDLEMVLQVIADTRLRPCTTVMPSASSSPALPTPESWSQLRRGWGSELDRAGERDDLVRAEDPAAELDDDSARSRPRTRPGRRTRAAHSRFGHVHERVEVRTQRRAELRRGE